MGASNATDAPRVSIPMVTFRHAHWVERAIESVLAQDESDWEIVLADDASDDGTVAMAEALVERCRASDGRSRLRILEHGPKFGPRRNYMRALTACRGTYVSQLDGDDFYVDPSKLRRQADFLDAHPGCSGVFGDWLETDAEGENGRLTRGFALEDKDRFDAVDFGLVCRTTSVVVMFRNGLFGAFPPWYTEVDVGDWPLHFLNTLHGGPYAYAPGVVAAHRNHALGVWSRRPGPEKIESALRTHDILLREAPEAVEPELRRRIYRWNRRRARSHLRHREPELARLYLGWCARHADLCADPLRFRWQRWRAQHPAAVWLLP